MQSAEGNNLSKKTNNKTAQGLFLVMNDVI